MSTRAEQEEEARELGRKYDTLRGYCDIGIKRVEFIAEFFTKVARLMRQAIPTIRANNVIDDARERFKNESGDKLSFFRCICQFTKVHDSLVSEFEETSMFIEEPISLFLNNQFKALQDMVGESDRDVEQADKARRECLDRLVKNQKYAEKVLDDAKKVHQKVTKAKQEGKVDKHHVDRLTDLVNEYKKATYMVLQSTDELNVQHQVYADAVSKGIKSLCEMERKRTEELMILFETFSGVFKRVVDIASGAKISFQRMDLNWERDFLKFVADAGITRGNLTAVNFEPYKFTFDDEELKVPPPETVLECMDAPLLLAKAVADFSPIGPHQMPLLKGETILLMEELKHSWVYGITEDRKKEGYVPVNVLEVVDKEIALVIQMHIPANTTNLPVAVGDIVVIVEQGGPRGTLCRNQKGEVGYIPTECLLRRGHNTLE